MGLLKIRRWPIWHLPSQLISAVLLVEMLALTLVALDVVMSAPSDYVRGGVVTALLVVGGITHIEISLRIERTRRRFTSLGHVDLSSVWTFAAALALPLGVASAAVVVLRLYLYLRVWRPAAVPLFKEVYSSATVLLAMHAAVAFQGYLAMASGGVWSATSLAPLVGALTAYTVVNTCLVVGVVLFSSDRSLKQVLGEGDRLPLEIATLSLGALLALVLLLGSPLHTLLVFPPLLLLHRAALAREVERAATTDEKTGLLTAGAWHQRATVQLARAVRRKRSAAMFVLDLDHFKQVNDTYGHLAGDKILKAVGTRLRELVRSEDMVGRFGGDEFVILMTRDDDFMTDRGRVLAVGERIRSGLAAIRTELSTPDGPLTMTNLSFSIGAAIHPKDGHGLIDLLASADRALLAAKAAGRNRVLIHPEHPVEVDIPRPSAPT